MAEHYVSLGVPVPQARPTRTLEHKVTRDDGTFVEEEYASLDKIGLSRNAKGETQIEVSVHRPDAAKAEAKACEVYDRLCARYPMPEKGAPA